MLSTLLATKLHRPRPTPNLLARPHLTQHLDEGLRDGHRLILVIAGVPVLLGWPAYWIIPIAVFGTLAVGYALLKWKGIAPRAG